MTPARFGAQLLQALQAAEGRRRRRRRDTTPDAIGLEIKRDLLRRMVADAPGPEALEAWLLQEVTRASAAGPVHAIGLEILSEYRMAATDAAFARWLEAGAPSADADAPTPDSATLNPDARAPGGDAAPNGTRDR